MTSVVLRGAARALLATSGLVGAAAWADPARLPLAVRQQALRSTVYISATGCADGTTRSGTGFALTTAGRIVTAHHVVGGCSAIIVRYEETAAAGSPSSRAATLRRVLPKGDLALLEVPDPPAIPALKLAPPPPDKDGTFSGLGYQNAQMSGSDLTVTFASGKSQLKNILTPALLVELQGIGSPVDVEQTVLRFNAPLEPGMSGGPIIDGHGEVIGIVAGGLKAGAAPASWGWPSEWVNQLLASAAPVNAPVHLSKSYFTLSDLERAHSDTVSSRRIQCGDLSFRDVGVRSFDDVARGADDFARVQYLAGLSRLDPQELSALRFHVWRHDGSGATALVPEGYALARADGVCVARSDDGIFEQVFWAHGAVYPNEIQAAAVQFERQVMLPRVPSFGFRIDPQLTTFMPNGLPGPQYRDNGLVFTRKGNISPKQPWTGPSTPLTHSFETLIARGGTFLGAGTINHTEHPMLQACLISGLREERCQQAREHLKVWTHFIMATQLSTYPAY